MSMCKVLTRQIPGKGKLDANENWRHVLGRENKLNGVRMGLEGYTYTSKREIFIVLVFSF